jgi:hypothetical protein
MKTEKKFDSVKMMREIRDKISAELVNMSPEQILEYIRNGRKDYENIITDYQQKRHKLNFQKK